MKKILSFTIFFAILFLIFQVVVTFFYRGHELTYDLKSEEKTFQITEKFFLEDKKKIYHIEVTLGDMKFLLSNQTDYNKRKKVITDIKWFESDGVTCIYPIYQDKLEDVHDIMCSKDQKQYTYTYLSTKYASLQQFQKNLIAMGILLPSWEGNKETEEISHMQVYRSHLPSKTYLGLWKYQGLQLVSLDANHYTSLLSSDSYQAKGVLAGEYYLLPNYDLTAEFDSFHIVPITSFGSRKMQLDFSISKDSYFNGVVDSKAYLFDKTNKKQYEIDPKNQKIREIGNTELNAQFYDGASWTERNIYDFVNQKVVFGPDFSKIEALQKYQPKQVVETKNSYYFSTSQGLVYRLYKDHLEQPVLLLEATDVIDLKVVNDFVFYLSGDTLFFYHEAYGLRPLVIHNEFRYNSTDMYVVYQK